MRTLTAHSAQIDHKLMKRESKDTRMLNWLQRSPNPNFTLLLEKWLACEGGVSLRSAFEAAMKEQPKPGAEQPYIVKKRVEFVCERDYNKNFGDLRECGCGHHYYRHFDSYEGNYDAGCKYCDCRTWHEGQNEEDKERERLESEWNKKYDEEEKLRKQNEQSS